MAEISTQAVIDAVTLALRGAYPHATILDDEAKQGIKPGAFIVQLVTAEQQKLMGQRYHRTPLLDVIYFSSNSAEECTRVGDNLCMVLGEVTTPCGDLLHGSGVNWSIEDGVLHFMVLYNHNVLLPRERAEMETLKVKEGALYG